MSNLKLSMRKIMCRRAKIIKYVFVFDFIVVLKLSDTNEVESKDLCTVRYSSTSNKGLPGFQNIIS